MLHHLLGLRKPRRRHHKKKMRGAGIMDFLGKANNFLKSSKLVSTIGNALGSLGVPIVGQIGDVAGSLGYGRHRRRMHRGGALKLAGGGLGLAGGYRRGRHRYLR